MQTFTVDPRRWWIGRLFARNPLLRRGDRIEVLAWLTAVMLSLMAIALAGAVGAEVRDAEGHAVLEQTQTHHLVRATITGVTTTTNFDGSEMAVVRAHWAAGNGSHADTFQWGKDVEPGDRVRIWVDDSGNHVNAPTPLRPALDAFTVAASIIVLTAIALTSMLGLMHWRLRRARDARWDREIRSLAKSP